ncbi:MAG: helix-turn-helix domain-containing protein [Symploca sp. SIO1C4]|uniref:Helix-turn-helix domain-containing protein n=1 Tax=Symploca sp. SIO1C4 TaxID=2607765 RepID=A0A6B3NIM8_9CYAN|nr:helix-turn-helix domain-containing protein [Symploca sp. SIO1C4]
MIKWRLSEVMARHQVTGRELANLLNRHESSITKIRATKIMPRLSATSLNELLNGLNKLKKTEVDHVITPNDLIDYEPGDLEESA